MDNSYEFPSLFSMIAAVLQATLFLARVKPLLGPFLGASSEARPN